MKMLKRVAEDSGKLLYFSFTCGCGMSAKGTAFCPVHGGAINSDPFSVRQIPALNIESRITGNEIFDFRAAMYEDDEYEESDEETKAPYCTCNFKIVRKNLRPVIVLGRLCPECRSYIPKLYYRWILRKREEGEERRKSEREYYHFINDTEDASGELRTVSLKIRPKNQIRIRPGFRSK